MFMLAALIAVSPPPAEQSAIFTAAGFKQQRGAWRTGCDQPGQGDYQPGAVETYRDLNGDGRPEAVVTEGGSYCYGNTGTGFWLLTRQANGRWTKVYDSQGVAEILETRGVARMPDISIGGPGFCFLVVRWNGKAYVRNRFEYEGKRCKP
jgi:hypothetical protein